jgi:gamma-glutamylaminecyclotransferase
MTHLVFVYGTLKQGNSNNRLLAGARCEGAAVTAESYGLNADGAPRVYRDAPRGYAAPVVGEVYYVDDNTLARLDSLEGHPKWYCREQVAVTVAGGCVLAWLYFMPVRHKTKARDLFRRPVYVSGEARHTWAHGEHWSGHVDA